MEEERLLALERKVQEMQDRETYIFNNPIAFFGVRPTGQIAGTNGDATNTYGLTSNAPTFYAGQVDSSGNEGSIFPTDWSSSGSTGTYTVTHNLGDTNYIALAVANSSNPRLVAVSHSSNSFTVRFESDTGTAFPVSFNFMVFRVN